jgi:GMP synthase PP-ATPase subunit
VSTQAPAGVRDEIARQQVLDRHWQSYQSTLEARLAAVVGGHRAFSERQIDADWALRQSLVDLGVGLRAARWRARAAA